MEFPLLTVLKGLLLGRPAIQQCSQTAGAGAPPHGGRRPTCRLCRSFPNTFTQITTVYWGDPAGGRTPTVATCHYYPGRWAR